MHQIKNLDVVLRKKCIVPVEEHQEYLDYEWFDKKVSYMKGETFGNLSLTDPGSKPRAGTAICSTDCKVLTLSKEDYQKRVIKNDQRI